MQSVVQSFPVDDAIDFPSTSRSERIAATLTPRLRRRLTILPSGRTWTSCGGGAGRATIDRVGHFPVFKSTTTTLLIFAAPDHHHLPSGVGAVPYPVEGSVTQFATLLVAIDHTARRGASSSEERALSSPTSRCLPCLPEIG